MLSSFDIFTRLKPKKNISTVLWVMEENSLKTFESNVCVNPISIQLVSKSYNPT